MSGDVVTGSEPTATGALHVGNWLVLVLMLVLDSGASLEGQGVF